MNNHTKSALSLALAIVGGIAAGMRCDASEWVENSSHFTPRGAAYTVKTYTDGSDPFDAGKLTVSIADYPRIEIEREYSDGSVMRRNVDRVLKFDISILSGEGCPCLKSKRQIKATQRLVAKDGVPVWEESYFTIEQ